MTIKLASVDFFFIIVEINLKLSQHSDLKFQIYKNIN